MSDGMDSPQLIPADQIQVDDNEAPDDIEDIRPNSAQPFTVDQNRITFVFWFMPAVPIKSIELVTSNNVESITVKYIKPTSATSNTVAVVRVSCAYGVVSHFFNFIPNYRLETKVFYSIKAV